ncbi:XkdX family protein [Clostridium sp. WILCCON 0269]|uniref:XkdX family protein n=1 Tax=Candidatus Clostridium eludens TaxID=3381663 RepID=A0ABW8SLT5_9CLOT
MLTFDKIQGYYNAGLWTGEMVANAVVKGKITADQYLQITGQTYTAPTS